MTDLIGVGYTEADLRAVVDKKCAEWISDPKMRGYLRPSTLFGPKFSEYLSQPEPIEAEQSRSRAKDRTKLNEQLTDLKAEYSAIERQIESETDPGRAGPLYEKRALCEDRIEAVNKRLAAMF